MFSNDRTDRAALRHPIFWLALVLLVVNDHWLKGADVAPAWLTGKLSDFAGLIVAPIALSALFSVRNGSGRDGGRSGARRRALAFVLVGGWFAAANLFGAVAEGTTALGAAFGLSWRFWVDPTDLVALSALPLAWHIADYRGGELQPRRWLEHSLLGFAIAACVASPPGEPTWFTQAFLVNNTGQEVEVRVQFVEAQVDCSRIASNFADALTRDAFEGGTRYIVGVRETLPLDRGAADGTADPLIGAPPVEAGHLGTCDVALISADGLPEVMVFWDGLTNRRIPLVVEDDEDERAVSGGLSLERRNDDGAMLGLSSSAATYQLAAPVDIFDDSSACREYGETTGFDWTALPPEWDGATVRLNNVRSTIDGCVSVDVENFGAFSGVESTQRIYFCVPPEDFPFLSRSEVRLTMRTDSIRLERDLRLDDGSLWRTGELVIYRGTEGFVEGPFSVGLEALDDSCGGVRVACGGFRMPAVGTIHEASGTRFLHPGDVVERDTADGRRARLRVGRAGRTLVAHPSCGAGSDTLGPRLEALVTYGEESR